MDKILMLTFQEKIPVFTASLVHVNVRSDPCQSLDLIRTLALCTLMWSLKLLMDPDSDIDTNRPSSYKATKKHFRLTLTRENEGNKCFLFSSKDSEMIELDEKLCYAAAATLLATGESDTTILKLSSNNEQFPKSFEYQELESCTKWRSSVSNFLRFTLPREDVCTEGLMHGLSDIELTEYTERLHCAAVVNPSTGRRVTEEYLRGTNYAATDAGRCRGLSENLRQNIEYIATRLTPGETDLIIMKLRSHKEQYLKLLDYEDLKDITGATRKANELIDRILKNERAVLSFVDALKEIGRSELCNAILCGCAM